MPNCRIFLVEANEQVTSQFMAELDCVPRVRERMKFLWQENAEYQVAEVRHSMGFPKTDGTREVPKNFAEEVADVGDQAYIPAGVTKMTVIITIKAMRIGAGS